jgi:mannose-1-phosphate guanylyltransferase
MEANKRMFEIYYGEKTAKIFLTCKKHLWGIVLAGGDGERLKDFVKKQYGYHRPKQYCTFTGTRSMIRHTLDRALMLIPREHLLTIITKHHHKYAFEELGEILSDTIISQPCARKTSAGILLPMLKINQNDPEAIVTIFPSDHFINDENYFMDNVSEANLFVKNNPDSIVMIGVKPDRIECGYGWIEPDSKILYSGEKIIKRVKRFLEKPGPVKAEVLWNNGCLWNTFVLIGRSATFIKHMQTCIPEVYNAFEPIRAEIGTSREKVAVDTMFEFIPAINFSRFVLEKIPEHLCVMEVSDIYWSDWGDENRIRNDIEKLDLNMIDSVAS